MIEVQKKEELFLKGLEAYHEGNYFDAHEYWENLWSDYYLEDRDFIQGLIQLSVSFVHLENGNLNGAKSLLKKCLGKFKDFERVHRGIDVNGLKYSIRKVQKEYENIKKTDDFNNNLIPDLI